MTTQASRSAQAIPTTGTTPFAAVRACPPAVTEVSDAQTLPPHRPPPGASAT